MAIGIVGRAITLEREPSNRSKELIPERLQRGLRMITSQGAKEKSLILLSQYWNIAWLDGSIIILVVAIIFLPTVIELLNTKVKWFQLLYYLYEHRDQL